MVETREKTVAVAAVDQFRSTLRGDLIGPADAEYEEARMVFNGMIDRHPSLIVRCADVADVIHAVNRLPVASMSELRASLVRLRSGDPIVLQVNRRGELRYISAIVE